MLEYLLSKLLTIIVFLIVFTVIVVSHEFGHFLLGRLNGIRINEFAIGMGPTIFKKRLKSTILKIHLLPIGGACVFASDDPMMGGGYEDEEELSEMSDSSDDRANILDDDISEDGELSDADYVKTLPGDKFQNASIWGRIATVIAGPLFNILLAYILSLFVVWFTGENLPTLYSVTEGYPAAEAGLQKGDTILKINNERVYLWREVSLISMMNSGETLDIVYERDGQKYTTTLTPKYSEEDDRYYIGFTGGGNFIKCNNLSVFKYSYCEVRFWLKATYKSLGIMLHGKGSMDDLSGPVGIATVIDDTIEESSDYGVFYVVLNMVNIAVLLSVNLGVINLLPFPAIDGGRLIFLLFELITRKKVPPEKEGLVHLIGFVLLFALMIIVFFNDIMRIFR